MLKGDKVEKIKKLSKGFGTWEREGTRKKDLERREK